MGSDQRPYVGTWNVQGKKVVQHTPDCLVYINGDLTIPGVDTKGRQYRIDLQKFITSVQVDCGNTPSGASANISLAIPTHSNEPIARDANHILTTGLEVHIYMRGYFPVRGLFRGVGDNIAVYDDDGNLRVGTFSESEIGGDQVQSAQVTVNTNTLTFPLSYGDLTIPDWIKSLAPGKGSLTYDQVKQWASEMGISEDMLVLAIMTASETSLRRNDAEAVLSTALNRMGYPSKYGTTAWQVVTKKSGTLNTTAKQSEGPGRQFSTLQWYQLVSEEEKQSSNGDSLTNMLNHIYQTLENRSNGTTIYEQTSFLHERSQRSMNAKEQRKYDACLLANNNDASKCTGIKKHKTPEAVQAAWTSGGLRRVPNPPGVTRDFWGFAYPNRPAIDYDAQKESILDSTKPVTYTSLTTDGTNKGKYIGQEENFRPKSRYDDLFAYPYYHVFHGCITNVSFSYSPGVQTATLQCGSMLHFWSYQNMSTNAAAFGARPNNSKNRMSLMGHNFTGQHPYEIVYTLFHDTAGAAGAVNFVMDQKTNIDGVLGENSLFSLNIKYWEKRFSQRVMNLRLHGATGALFNTLQATAMANITTDELQSAFNARNPRLGNQGASAQIMESLRSLGLIEDRKKALQSTQQQQQAQSQAQQQSQGQVTTPAQLDQASFGNSGGFSGGKPLDLNVFMMEAFVKDIGQIASINLFESSYETKMDIVNKVCEVTGFEFYQDVDGDCVFKPPMYNLDTSSSRVYRIEDIDIISFSESHKEPEATYMITKGSTFANLAGTGVDGEWGVQGTFIDYPLVAKYGWRSGSFETQYFNDSKQCFFACINRMAVMNASINSANTTIPIRPEIRPGYPVYIPTYDCFYYCTTVSHAYQVGGACQTTLQLIAKRKKFYAPGNPNQSGIESIQLDGFALPPKPLQVLRKDGYSELSGFPNVVMTLDPNLVNPMFYVSGADFESLTNTENLENLANILVQSSTSGNVFTYDDKTKILSWKQGKDTKYFSVAEVLNSQGRGTAQDPYNLFAIAGKRDERRLSTTQSKYNTQLANQQAIVAGIDEAINKLNKERSKIGRVGVSKKGKENQRALDSIDEAIKKQKIKKKKAQKKLDKIRGNAPTTSNNAVFTSKAKGIDYLLEMLTHVRKYGKYDSNRFGKGFKDLESSANLLDLIGNKKASLSNGQLPGSYRYYSSAHPDPNHQGRKLAYQTTGANNNIATVKGSPAPLTKQKISRQYVPSSNITVSDTIYLQPEAELNENAQVFNGIPVIGGDGNEEVVPTDEITTLRFTKVKGKTKVRKWVRRHDYQEGLLTVEDFFKGIVEAMSGISPIDGGRFKTTVRKMCNADGYDYVKNRQGEGGYEGIHPLKITEFLHKKYIEKFENNLPNYNHYGRSNGWNAFTIGSQIQSNNSDEVVRWILSRYYTGNPDSYTVPWFQIGETVGHAGGIKTMYGEGLKYFFFFRDYMIFTDWHDNQDPNVFIDSHPMQYHTTTSLGCLSFMGIDLSDYFLEDVLVTFDYVKGYVSDTPVENSIYIEAYRAGWLSLTTGPIRDEHGFVTLTENYGNTNGKWIWKSSDFNRLRLSEVPVAYGSSQYCEAISGKSFTYGGSSARNIVIGSEGEQFNYNPLGRVFFNITERAVKELELPASWKSNNYRWASNTDYSPYYLDNTSGFWNSLEATLAYGMAQVYFEWWEGIEPIARQRGVQEARKAFDFVKSAFSINKQAYSTRMVHAWVWQDITTEVPVFPISDHNGYEVFGHYPYGRGLDIFANNPFDTILKTDPFSAVDRKTVENYVAALQGKQVTITDPQGVNTTFSSGQNALNASTKALEEAVINEYSAQEILDYGLGTINESGKLNLSIQNWLADKSRDGVQKLTVENRAFSIADLGFLSDLASLPSDLKSSQSDVLLPAYSNNFAEIIAGTQSSNHATLLEQLISPTSSGEDKPIDMTHTIIVQEGRSANWAVSQTALRGRSLETRNSADILKEGLETLTEDFERTIQTAESSLTDAFDSRNRARENMDLAFEDKTVLDPESET